MTLDEIKEILNKLEELCPECAKAPVVNTNLPGTGSPLPGFGRRFPRLYTPECPNGQIFDSRIGICVNDPCAAPEWLKTKIPQLEKAANLNKIQIKHFSESSKCEKDYLIMLIDFTMKYAEDGHGN